MKIVEPDVWFDWRSVPQGKDVVCHQKLYKDVAFIYEQQQAVDADTIMYTVYSIPEQTISGHLLWGLSIVHPVWIGSECNMTRGHFHKNTDCQEYYWGMSGQGLLMLIDDTGYCWAENVYPGSLHRIDGHWAHRLINVSDEDLAVVCCWPANAGHDYKRMETELFPYRIHRKDGHIQIKACRP